MSSVNLRRKKRCHICQKCPISPRESLFRSDWNHSISICKKIVACGVPLSYTTQVYKNLAASSHILEDDQPHYSDNDYVEEDLIYCSSHSHPLFRNDNRCVFYCIYNSLCGTKFYATIVQYLCTCDCRSAFQAIVSQHAVQDV